MKKLNKPSTTFLNFKKVVLGKVVLLICLLSIIMVPLFVSAKGVPPPSGPRDGLNKSVANTGIRQSQSGVAGFIGLIIKSLLGLLSVVFIILIIYAGFMWMTSRGESDKITKAKQILTSSIIGIIIILSAYIITDFVISKAQTVTGLSQEQKQE